MTKEIINTYVKGESLNFKNLKLSKRRLQKTSRIIFVGAGACYSKALAGAGAFESLTDILISAYPAGEFRFSPTKVDSGTLLFAIAEGEENDTVACIKRVKAVGGRVISVCTNEESTVVTSADVNLNPVSNGFSEVTLVLTLLAVYVGARAGMVSSLYQSVAIRMADMLAGKIAFASKYNSALDEIKAVIDNANGVIACGRGADYAAAVELSDYCGVTPCYISELVGMRLENKTILAFISGKDYLDEILFYLNTGADSGADVLIITTDEVAEEINNPNGIVAVSGSLPIFNPIVLCEAVNSALKIEQLAV